MNIYNSNLFIRCNNNRMYKCKYNNSNVYIIKRIKKLYNQAAGVIAIFILSGYLLY